MKSSMMRALFVACLLVASCRASDGPDSTSPDTGATALEPVERPESLPADSLALALDPEGFRFVDPASGSTHLLEFGTRREAVVGAVANRRGQSTDRGINTECGAGPLAFESWEDGLTLWFSDDSFAGWIIDGRGEGAGYYTTMAGVGAGSSRASLSDAYDVQIEETTLGTEFSAGELFGLLDGAQADATITTIWAGVSCLFR